MLKNKIILLVVCAFVSGGACAAENTTEYKPSASGSYLSSRFSRSTGDIPSATAALQKLYKQDADNTEIASQLMGLYLLQGKVDSALEIASGIVKKNDKEPISSLMLSLQAIKKNKPAEAAKILDRVFEGEGGQLWLPLISAWLDAEQKKLLKPITMEELSAEVGRAAPLVSYHLALINSRAGFATAAAENFRDAIEDPEHPPARVMNMLLAFYEKNNQPEILKPIVAKFRAANANQSQVKLPPIDNMQDGVAEVLFTIGSIMLAGDSTQEATLYLQLALYIKPDMQVATLALAQAYGELQQYGIASEILAKIPKNSDLYSNAQLYSAVNLGRMKKYDEAIKKLDELIAATPSATTPDNVDLYMAKGDLLRLQERFADALTVYKTALSTVKEPTAVHWQLFFAIATCYDKQNNWQETEKNLTKSIELSPNQPDTLNYYGYSLLMRGEKLAEAKSMIEKALKKRSSDPQIIDSMGWAHYLLGEYEQAAEYMEKAVSLLPADATVNEHLGDIYWRLSRKTEARFQWDRAITYSTDENLTLEIKKKLKDGLPQLATENVAPSPSAAPVTAAVAE